MSFVCQIRIEGIIAKLTIVPRLIPNACYHTNDPGPISSDDWCTCVTNFTVSLWLCVMFVMTRLCSLSSAIISTWAGNLHLPLSASYHKWDYIKIKMSENLIIWNKTLALPNLTCPIELKCGSFHKRVNDVQVISAWENIMRIVGASGAACSAPGVGGCDPSLLSH